jgi:ABC-type Fe3+ transport system substrate-binding protein
VTKAACRNPLGLCLAAASLCLVWSSARAESLDQLYEKAKAEKTLVLYTGGPAGPWESSAKAFAARFPGLEIAVTGGFSNVLDREIDAQIKVGKLAVDMAAFQTAQDFVRWKQEGVLLHFKPEGFAAVAPEFKDKDGAYIALTATTLSYAYNPALVKPEDVPKSALDFLKPVFHGGLITAYPADDDATLYVFDTIVGKYGWSYMDRYMANAPKFIQGHLGIAHAIAQGQALASFDATLSTVGALKRAGEAIELAFSPVDATPVFTLTAGIFARAPHPNLAKLYLTWYLAKEQQAHTGVYSTRRDLPPPAGLKPLSALQIANHYREFVSDDQRMTELRQRFAAYTGPVINQGGIR